MGTCVSSRESDLHTSMINQELNHDKREQHDVTKILFLGSGGSGKSTIFKQLRGIYGEGFNRQEMKIFISQIHEQVIRQMKYTLEILEEYRMEDSEISDVFVLHQNESKYVDQTEIKLELNLYDGSSINPEDILPELSEPGKKAEIFLNDIGYTDFKLTDEIVSALQCLWAEPAIQRMYAMRNITKISDSSAYFWDKLDQINSPKYVPDSADILLVRSKSTGVTEQEYNFGATRVSVIDVGGQRSERKKWINCFAGVTAVIFVADLSCYNEVLYEDYYTNAMTDQLELFDDICNCDTLKHTAMILFLNKKDIFENKIKRVQLTKCSSFADYSGQMDSYVETTKYISDVFSNLNKKPSEKDVYAHLTCATDYDNIQKVFADIACIVCGTNLEKAGISM
eukprot:296828_1